MEWHINDLSLNGQFANPLAFRAALEPVLQLRRRDPLLRSRLYCSRTLCTRPATATMDLRQTVTALHDTAYTGLVLAWMAKSDPFWDDERQHNEDDYFEYQGTDVTDQGLGEATRRTLAEIKANAFSFQGGAIPFTISPLTVTHGLPEEPITNVNIDNYWDVALLERAIQSARSYRCWTDVHSEIKRRFTGLIFQDNLMQKLQPTPFSDQVRKRIFMLLSILDQLVAESNDAGKLSQTGEEILRNYFAGNCAEKLPLFKPETKQNKHDFKNDLTFRDPSDDSKTLFCHWHGKIQTPQTRIHFEWPRPNGQREIKVVYIGPKITKN